MIEWIIAMLVDKLGPWGSIGAAVIYIVLQIVKNNAYTQAKTIVKEGIEAVMGGWGAVQAMCSAAYDDGVVTEDEATDIFETAVTAFVMRPGMLLIEVLFLIVPLKSIVAIIAFLRRK